MLRELRPRKQAESPEKKKTATTKIFGKLAAPEAASKWQQPPFTLKQVRDSIPKHCFEKSVFTSLSYVAIDVGMISLLAFLATKISTFDSIPIQVCLWIAYSVVQAWFGVGIWILAHECGHGAFSDYKLLNDVVGWILHSVVMIPYFSWKYSHSKHHKGTGHKDKDMVFIPATRDDLVTRWGIRKTNAPTDRLHNGDESLISQTPLEAVLFLLGILIAGFPLYLLQNLGGQRYKTHSWVSHYFPSAPIFEPKHAMGVILSNIGLLLWVSIQVALGYQFGWHVPVLYFVLPWSQVNAWLVLITYLQHTDPVVPHYSNAEWDFLKGALATIDRDWGFLNVPFHHITDTHVVHHLFSNLPFYHAQEATEAVKKVLGKQYLRDDNNPFYAIYRNHLICKFVDPSDEVMFYKH